MSKFLGWQQERIKHWTKPASLVLIIGILSDLTRSHIDLVVENALLRQQLIVLNRQIKRPRLTPYRAKTSSQVIYTRKTASFLQSR